MQGAGIVLNYSTRYNAMVLCHGNSIRLVGRVGNAIG